jgi:hypothetical protein
MPELVAATGVVAVATTTAELAKIDAAALSDTIAGIIILRPMRMIPP